MTVDAAQIEAYLYARKDWVRAKALCAHFDIRERSLRALNRRGGLVSTCAISSSQKGFKHIEHATTAEWLEFKHSLRKHAIAELSRVRALERRRSEVRRTFKSPPAIAERDSGQLIFPTLIQEMPHGVFRSTTGSF